MVLQVKILWQVYTTVGHRAKVHCPGDRQDTLASNWREINAKDDKSFQTPPSGRASSGYSVIEAIIPSFLSPSCSASMLILWQTVVLSGVPIHPQDVLSPNSFGLTHQDVVKLHCVKSTASHGLSEVRANDHTTHSCNPINLRFLLKIASSLPMYAQVLSVRC
ncbi:hypothetical protein B0H17DRAFT_1136544 [Mycena rosella]|uniref:Uncharacterized protein n=1 Tax=Mycena rosella TaxID=1033263 RepID=A0AAD7DAZ1_MYCRO|nr:hypothetical protein B0H17DRAFT_1136544 [Mycena rosella]